MLHIACYAELSIISACQGKPVMNYLIAVLSDRIQAEAAYSALEKQGLPMDKVTIFGKGHQSAEEFSLIDPKENAGQLIRLMSYWLIPFGFGAGFVFSFITQLDTFAWAGEIGNHLIGGLLGAGAGAMGSFFVGRGSSLTSSDDPLPYRNRLNLGKYLVVVQGTEDLIRKATGTLRQFNPESIQGYGVI